MLKAQEAQRFPCHTQNHGMSWPRSSLLLCGGCAIALISLGLNTLVESLVTERTPLYSLLPLYVVPVLILAMVHYIAWQLYIYN